MGTKKNPIEVTAICPRCEEKNRVIVNITLPDNLVVFKHSENCKLVDIPKTEEKAKEAITETKAETTPKWTKGKFNKPKMC